MIVLSIFDDASGKIDSINDPIISLKISELIGIYLFHDLQSKIDEFFISIFFFIAEQRIRHSFNSSIIFFFSRCKLSRFNINRLSNELIVVFTHCIHHN
jgi:hypothetical protein